MNRLPTLLLILLPLNAKVCEQRPEAVQAWFDAQYPEIEQRAKAEGAEIH